MKAQAGKKAYCVTMTEKGLVLDTRRKQATLGLIRRPTKKSLDKVK